MSFFDKINDVAIVDTFKQVFQRRSELFAIFRSRVISLDQQTGINMLTSTFDFSILLLQSCAFVV